MSAAAPNSDPGGDVTDRLLEQTILGLLEERAAGSTICPSDAARAVGGTHWRDLMEPTRAAARRLVSAGILEITQGGKAVDASKAKGPIRIRRVIKPAKPASATDSHDHGR